MSIISQTFGLLGQDGVIPRRVQMVVTDSLSTVTTAGYLQFAGVNTDNVQPTDIFDLIYLFSTVTGIGTYGEFLPVFSGGIITLVENAGGLSIPVSGADGGTGVSNPGKTITLGGDLTLAGAYDATFNFTGATNVVFPTSGTLATTTEVLNPVNQSTTSVTAVSGNLYCVTSAGTCTITLPAVAAFGNVVGVIGQGAGGWILAPGAGQTVKILGNSASASVASAGPNDCIFVICVIPNTTWVAYSFDTAGFVYS